MQSEQRETRMSYEGAGHGLVGTKRAAAAAATSTIASPTFKSQPPLVSNEFKAEQITHKTLSDINVKGDDKDVDGKNNTNELIESSRSKPPNLRKARTLTSMPAVQVDVRNASEAVSFYKEAFGAYEYESGFYPPMPNTVELNLRGVSVVINERPDLEVYMRRGGPGIFLYYENAFIKRALSAGAVVEADEVVFNFFGLKEVRRVTLRDRFNVSWIICSPVTKNHLKYFFTKFWSALISPFAQFFSE